jgi:hypothetical protein
MSWIEKEQGRVVAITVLSVFMGVLGLTLLGGCQDAPPPYLQSHPSWEMFPRASSPPPDCPGQYRMVVENISGDFFLGCWGIQEQSLNEDSAITAVSTQVRDLGH